MVVQISEQVIGLNGVLFYLLAEDLLEYLKLQFYIYIFVIEFLYL